MLSIHGLRVSFVGEPVSTSPGHALADETADMPGGPGRANSRPSSGRRGSARCERWERSLRSKLEGVLQESTATLGYEVDRLRRTVHREVVITGCIAFFTT